MAWTYTYAVVESELGRSANGTVRTVKLTKQYLAEDGSVLVSSDVTAADAGAVPQEVVAEYCAAVQAFYTTQLSDYLTYGANKRYPVDLATAETRELARTMRLIQALSVTELA